MRARASRRGPLSLSDGLRDGTVIDLEELLKILPDVFQTAIAYILSELDYERNLECNTAIAVRLLAIWAARVKDNYVGAGTASPGPAISS